MMAWIEFLLMATGAVCLVEAVEEKNYNKTTGWLFLGIALIVTASKI